MSFIHFGCWGNLNKKAKLPIDDTRVNYTYPLFHVIEAIQHEQNVKFITVAGDNYYPDKIKNKEVNDTDKDKKKDKKNTLKVIKEDDIRTLMSQINTLSSNHTQVYLLYGNHEMSNEGILDSSNTPGKSWENKKGGVQRCLALTEQVKYINKNNSNISHFKNTMYNILNDNTIVIMLDTTIYDQKEEKNENHMTCYTQFEILYNKSIGKTVKNSEDLRVIQLVQVINILQNEKHNKIKNFIFIGHHPIISSKVKDGVDMESNIHLQMFFRFVDSLLSYRLSSSNIYYLCADTHLYEKSKIVLNPMVDTTDGSKPITITQYIVGTGGTDLDEQNPIGEITKFISKKESNMFKYITYEPDLHERIDDVYGYLRINSTASNKLNFEFKKVVNKKGEILWNKTDSRPRRHTVGGKYKLKSRTRKRGTGKRGTRKRGTGKRERKSKRQYRKRSSRRRTKWKRK